MVGRRPGINDAVNLQSLGYAFSLDGLPFGDLGVMTDVAVCVCHYDAGYRAAAAWRYRRAPTAFVDSLHPTVGRQHGFDLERRRIRERSTKLSLIRTDVAEA